MLKSPLWTAAIFISLVATPATSQDPVPGAQSDEQHATRIPGTGYDVVLGGINLREPDSASSRRLLVAIEAWLSSEFDLATIHEHPRIEFAPVDKIAALRSDTEIVAGSPGSASSEGNTVAIYHDATRTIYLPESWTGNTPAELSMLVHEIAHHFQNVLGLKHECPQEREKLAYRAQDRWLGLFGHSLADAFDLDPFSLFVKIKCFY
jgi:hypothetical protein